MRTSDEIPATEARRVAITGRVQGVGFRWHARLEARAIGVRGWVRNLEDGSVEAWIEGTETGVDEMLAYLAEGPSGARVDTCEAAPVVPRGEPGFEIR